MPLKTRAATEIAQFLAHHPTPEQIVAFHPSTEVAERAYKLIHAERGGLLTEEVLPWDMVDNSTSPL